MFEKSTQSLLGTIMAGGVLLLAAGAANATLLGDQVDVRITRMGDFNEFLDVTVDNSVELPGVNIPGFGGSPIAIDIDDSTITITTTIQQGPISGAAVPSVIYRFTDLDWVGVTGGFVESFSISNNPDNLLNPTSSFTRIILGGGGIEVVQNGFVTTTGSGFDVRTATISIVANHPTPLPEPTALAIFGVGLAGLGLMVRRGRKVTA